MKTYLLASLALINSVSAFATFQIPDEVDVDGVAYKLYSSPIIGAPNYLLKQIDEVKAGLCTASWRGYKAYWEVSNNKLFLKAIQGDPCEKGSPVIPSYELGWEGLGKKLRELKMCSYANIEALLICKIHLDRLGIEGPLNNPDIKDEQLIHAEWFSGELLIAMGDRIDDFESKDKQYLTLHVRNGDVVDKSKHDGKEQERGEEAKVRVLERKARATNFKGEGTAFMKHIAIPIHENYGTDIISLQKYIKDLSNADQANCLMASMAYVSDGYFCRSLYRDKDEKIKLLSEAAELGHPIAMNELAMTLDRDGNPEHSPKIKSLIMSAATKGIPHAQVSAGYWFMTGKHGFSIDYAEAMQWNVKAYKQGHSEGANNIGEIYENGLGVARNIKKAKEWYKKASLLGNKDATKRLQKISTKSL